MKMTFTFSFIFGLASLSGTGAVGTAEAAARVPAERGRSHAVTGVVVDGTGGALPGAAVTVRVGPLERKVVSDAQGRFHLDLFPGTYDVSAEASGFSVAQQRLTVGPTDVPEMRLTLRPGVFAEDVTVVGTRLAGGPEAVRRIPGSFEFLDSGLLEAARVFNVTEALRKATGVNVRDEEGFGLRPNIGIRGLNPTRSTKTLLLEDGLPLTFAPYGDNATYYHPPIERFEGVEILKGSGQIAYGPVTVGGVVNYLTPGPPSKPSASVTLGGGNRDYKTARAQGGGTWGRTGLLVDITHKRGDGARDNVNSKLNDVNAKGVFTLSPDQTLTIKGNFYGEDSQITYSGLRLDEFLANPRQNPFQNDAFTGRRYGASVKHAWALGDNALLTTQAYGSRFSRDWWRQSSNSGQRPNDSSDPACGGMANLLTACGNEGRLRDYDHGGVEPRLRFGHHLLGVASEAEVGVRAHFEVQKRRQENGDAPTARSGKLVEDNRRENQAYSAFVQNRILIGRATLTPGVRFETIDYERTNRLANSGLGVSGRTSVSKWIPGLGLAWTATDTVAFFAGVHRGFAPPRTEDVINNTTGGVVDLDPELSWNYEAGLRTQLHAGLRLEGTVFRMDYENQIVPASIAGGLGAALTNGGATLHQGFEISARLDTTSWTQSRHNVFVRGAFTAVPTARFEGARLSSVPGFSTVSVSGNRLPYAPKRELTAAIGYTGPSGVNAQLEVVHLGAQFADDLNSLNVSPDGQRGLIPAFTIWNASLNYEVKALRSVFFVTVKNASDRLYIVDRSRGVLPGPPRLVHAGLTARF